MISRRASFTAAAVLASLPHTLFADGLLETAQAVTAFDATQLQSTGIENLNDLALRTPGLNSLVEPAAIGIRGIAGLTATPGRTPGVAVYRDGVYTTDPGVFDDANLFDVARVEVLRGPQGTLYGHDAMAGAIRLVGMTPGMAWHSKVVAELGNYDYRALQGLISGPITDQFSMLVAGSTIDRSGDDEIAERDTQYLRAAFKYHWNNLWYSQIQLTSADRSGSQPADSLEGQLLNELAFGDYRLKYLAAWSELDADRDIASERDSVTHDLQFYSQLPGRLNFVSGIYANNSEEDGWRRDLPALERRSLAAYGQADWDWTERTQLTAGLRYSSDDMDSGALEQDWDQLDWRLGLGYRLFPAQMLYASLASGYRRAGLTAPTPIGTSLEILDPEDLLTAELGYKGSLLEQRLQLACAAYYSEYDNRQATATDTTLWGAELEITARLGEHLTAGGAWSWNDARDGELPLNPGRDLRLYGAYRWTVGPVNLLFTLEYMYTGEQDLSPLYSGTDARERWDSRIGASWGAWDISAWVRNIADDSDWLSRQEPALDNEPRTFGLRLVYQL